MSDDRRLVPAAVAAWAATWIGVASTLGAATAWLGALVVLAALWRRSARWLACGLVVAVCAGTAAWRTSTLAEDPITGIARQQRVVQAEVIVDADAKTMRSQFGTSVQVPATIVTVEVSGRRLRGSEKVTLRLPAREQWQPVVGQRVSLTVRLREGRLDRGIPLVAQAVSTVHEVAPPPLWLSGVNHVREGLRRASDSAGGDVRALLPALTVGDVTAIPEDLTETFSATGMTHLTAVSGSNLTLLLAFVGISLRWVGVRGRGLHLAAVATAGLFVVLCRAEPSVVRAAAMGLVMVASLEGADDARRGLRGLSLAVIVLLLVDPWLATSWGFALSVVACAGIVWCAARWVAAMTWCPRPLAEALCVTLAAQIATLPLVVALSGQISVVGLATNLAAAPFVGPATLLGVVAAVVALVAMPLASMVASMAALPIGAIAAIARGGAGLPGASVAVQATPITLAVVALGCAVALWKARAVLRRPLAVLVVGVMLLVICVGGVSRPGWPPSNWALASCDVGQGDATVIAAGHGRAVVVDTGPEPRLLDRCLSRLHVSSIPLLILTHDHADHVNGLAGLGSRPIALALLSRTPSSNRAALARDLRDRALQVREGVESESLRIADVVVTVVQAPSGAIVPGADIESPEENDGGLVIAVATTAGRVLITGDLGPEGQERLLARGLDLRCDVLKVPHHGSAHQSAAFLAAAHPRVALISVGAGNPYGHPAARTLTALAGISATIVRTDQGGSLALAPREDGAVALVSEK